MRIHMKHKNGNEWDAWRKKISGVSCYVLSNKNPLKHLDKHDATVERGNEERFYIYVPDARSVINGLQFGLYIRMEGIGDNGKLQKNLFKSDNILVDGKPIFGVAP